jgi:hypothetical protein
MNKIESIQVNPNKVANSRDLDEGIRLIASITDFPAFISMLAA